MKKISTIIVDDEPLARRGIRSQLGEYGDIEIIAECRDGREAIGAIIEHSPDLVFLDIQMPEYDGFAVLRQVGPDSMPAVIFVTAYDEHALKAFEVHALDYLLKPIDEIRLQEALAHARAQIEQRRTQNLTQRLQSLIDDLGSRTPPRERLVIRSSSGRMFFVNVSDIDWIQAADNYVKLFIGGETHMLRETMTNLARKLDPSQFLRVHRSSIVNVKRIKEIHPLLNGIYEIILRNGIRISTGRIYREQIQNLLEL